MQALILAAGVGKRLGGDIPKPLLRVGGQTLMERLVEQLRSLGITQIVGVTGHCRQAVEEVLKALEVQSVFNPHYSYSDNLVSFWVGQNYINEQCLMVHGDLIVEDQVLEGLIGLESDLILPMDRSSVNPESMKIKVVEGNVVNLTKALSVAEATGESLPVMLFSSGSLIQLKKITAEMAEEGRGKNYIDDAVFKLIDMRQVGTQIFDVTGLNWMEIDTPADLAQARRIFGEEPC
jgi:choline kinase